MAPARRPTSCAAPAWPPSRPRRPGCAAAATRCCARRRTSPRPEPDDNARHAVPAAGGRLAVGHAGQPGAGHDRLPRLNRAAQGREAAGRAETIAGMSEWLVPALLGLILLLLLWLVLRRGDGRALKALGEACSRRRAGRRAAGTRAARRGAGQRARHAPGTGRHAVAVPADAADAERRRRAHAERADRFLPHPAGGDAAAGERRAAGRDRRRCRSRARRRATRRTRR